MNHKMKEAPIMFSIRILKAVNEGKTAKTVIMSAANIPSTILNKYLCNLVDNHLVKLEEVRRHGFSGGVMCCYTITPLGISVITDLDNCLSKMGFRGCK